MANKVPSDLSANTPAVADITITETSAGTVGRKIATLLPSYTAALLVANTPSAVTYAGCIVYVSDGASNKRLAVADGTIWRFPDGNAVS